MKFDTVDDSNNNSCTLIQLQSLSVNSNLSIRMLPLHVESNKQTSQCGLMKQSIQRVSKYHFVNTFVDTRLLEYH